ncbi:MAG: hypothetical protein IKP38_07485 [Clostridia bacterium]|nr:hypothetical protein [Clostridia bacterium]
MRYYEVTAKCGHVGRGYYIPIGFAVRAETASEAAAATRAMPRVKHDHKDAILSVREVDVFEYDDLQEVNRYDPYLQCRSKREQMTEYDAIYNRLVEERRNSFYSERDLSEKAVYDGKKRIRNVRRYARELAAAYAMRDVI